MYRVIRKAGWRLIITYLSFNITAVIYCQDLIPPSCYGGEKQFAEFFKEEVVYPEISITNKEEGLVSLLFIVGSDGKVRNLKVWQSAFPALDKEAIRIFKLLQWHPAVFQGSPKDMETFLKFKFKIRKYRQICKLRGYDKTEYPYLPVDTSGVIYKCNEVDTEPLFNNELVKTSSFEEFFSNNMKYPETAFKQNITGTVIIIFIVETNGRISNVQITKQIGAGCSAEVRSFFKLTRWVPGILEGKAVRVQMKYAVNFETIDGYQYITYTNLKNR